MRKLLTLMVIFMSVRSSAQTPFAPYKKEAALEKVNTLYFAENKEKLSKKEFRKKQIEEIRKSEEVQKIEKTDFFEHYSANVVSIQNGNKLFPTINGEIINYKLGIWSFRKKEPTPAGSAPSQSPNQNTSQSQGQDSNQSQTQRPNSGKPNNEEKDSIVIHYVPFSIISKVSANYMDAEAGTLNDATSFFGAPLTFRFAPSFDLTKKSDYNKLFFGFNGDMRLLAIGDTVANKLDAGWGAYGSVGMTYMGTGYAYDGDDTDEGKRYHGKWSISAMLYWFKSGGTFNKAVFGDYQAKTISGIEMLLRFKTNKKENSKFNFIIGASNGFTREAPNFAKWQFRIGVGS